VGNHSEFSNLEELTDGQVHITFGYENPRLDYLLFRKDEIIQNIQVHSEMYGRM